MAPGDRLHQIDGISTIGLTNNHVLSILHQNDGPAVIEIEYCLPDYSKLCWGIINMYKCSWSIIVQLKIKMIFFRFFFFFPLVSQNSLCVTSKLAQITVERENGCFGLTLRGGGEYQLIVTNVRPHGPAFKTGRIKPGDRLLRVDNVMSYARKLFFFCANQLTT